MIAGATRGAGGGALGAHLANAEYNEQVRMGESRGLTAMDIRSQIDELTRMASHARTSTPIYHVHADPPAGRPWNAEERARYWELFEREFGLEGRPFASAIHVKEGREHEHRAYLRIRPDGTAIRLDHDHARREKISRVMEFERGEALTKGAHNRAVIAALRGERPEIAQAMESQGLHEGTRPRARVTPRERKQEERTRIPKSEVAKLTATAWMSSDNGSSFIAALREQGLALAQGDKVPVVVDQSGNTHSLARILSMASREAGEPSPRAADIQSRLQGVELPSLDDVRGQGALVPPVHDAALVIPPEPPQPGGGEPVQVIKAPQTSQDGSAPVGVSTPSNDQHGHMPAAASTKAPSPKSGGGGGGGGSAQSEQSSPLPSLDVGRGPGEPPGPGAHPDEVARHRAAVADFQERKERAWFAFIRAMDGQNKPRGKGATAGGSDVGIDEKGIRESASRLIREIEDGIERGITLKAFYAAWDTFKRNNAQGFGAEEPHGNSPAPERGESSGTGRPDGDTSRRDAPTQGGDAHRDGGNCSGLRHHSGEPERGARTARPHRTAFEQALERAQIATAGTIVSMSALRAEMVHHRPDPLQGLHGTERREKLGDLNRELFSEFQRGQRQDFAEELARERMRAHPLAQSLRAMPKRNLTAEQERDRTQGWSDIKAAHAALVLKLREQRKTNREAGFLQFLEFRSHTDPRAAAVFEDMKSRAERNRKIRAELAKGDARVAELRASEPKGERDPELSARAAKTALYNRLREAQQRVKDAQERLCETPRPWKVIRWIASIGFAAESVKKWVSAEQAVERAIAQEKAVTPHYLDIDQAEGKARNAAVQNERAHAVWRAGPGAELATLEPRMAEVHTAVDRKDWRITDALAMTGIDAALDEVRKREEREERRRAAEARKAEYGARVQQRGQVVEFPAAPRMR